MSFTSFIKFDFLLDLFLKIAYLLIAMLLTC